MAVLTTYPEGIHAIDSGYLREKLAAIHAVVSNDAIAIVDTGNNETAPRVLSVLGEMGYSPAQVQYILLTHIHLDHAGGAGAFMAACPNARLVVHPRGVRHMVDPSKLWAGTVAVYGEEDAVAKYGKIQPVAAERIIEATDGLVLNLGGRKIRVAETPGHAAHHVCYFDEQTRAWFTGDTFGLSYRELDHDGKQFVFPSTTPVQFDPEALHASIDRMMAEAPTAMYLTHYSRVTDLPRLASDLHRLIDAHVAIARSGADALDHRHQIIRNGLSALMRQEAARQQWPLDEDSLFDIFAMDLELNAQGLEVWLDKQSA